MKKGEALFIFLLYPIYSLPWIIQLISKNQYIGYLLLSFFMGLCAYTMMPYDTMDIVKHYEAFEFNKTLTFNELVLYNSPTSLALYIYGWIVCGMGLPKEFIPFSITFVTYMLYFSVIRDIFQSNKEKYNIGLSFVLLFVFILFNEIRFVDITSGLRNGLAFAIFIYGIYRYLQYGGKMRFTLLSLVSCFIHLAVFPLFILFIVSQTFTFCRFYKLLFYAGIFIFISGVGEFFFFKLMDLMEPILREGGLYFKSYMSEDGVWGSGFYEGKNLTTIVYEKYMRPLPFIAMGIYMMFEKKSHDIRYINYFYLLFFLVAIVSISRTMADRYSLFVVTLFIFYLTQAYICKGFTKYRKKFIVLFVVSLLTVSMGSMYKYRDTLMRSWTSFLYKPLPFLFQDSIEEKDYIIRHGN